MDCMKSESDWATAAVRSLLATCAARAAEALYWLHDLGAM